MDRPSANGHALIVTGVSGAGKSTALKALEDVGYDAVDNPPLAMVRDMFARMRTTGDIAIGIDVRSQGFEPTALIALLQDQPDIRLLFLDCDIDVAIRRFTETRRRHPLVQAGSPAEGVAAEKTLLAPLSGRADRVIDTSMLTARELRRIVQGAYGQTGAQRLGVEVESFSFAQGAPRNADMVFDVRFLANPHYTAALRPLTGMDAPVREFIEADPNFAPFMHRIQELVLSLLPLFEAEGKSYLNIAIGCTGGRHRSIAATERLGAVLTEGGWPVRIVHREVERKASMDALEGAA